MYLTFLTGGERLAVPLARSRGVLSGVVSRSLPGSLPWVRGVLLREGVVVPIVDLVALASGRPSPPDGRETVVIDAGETHLGLLAAEPDAAPGEAPGGDDAEAPEGWIWLSDRVMVAGRSCWALDPEALARACGA